MMCVFAVFLVSRVLTVQLTGCFRLFSVVYWLVFVHSYNGVFKWNMLQVSPVVCGFILTIIRHPRSQGPSSHCASGWRQAPSTLPGLTC